MRLRAAAGVAILCAAAQAGDHPIGGDRLVLKAPANAAARSVRFKAARDPAVDPAQAPDPRVVGATLEVVGRGPGDGTSGVVALDAAKWQGIGRPAGAKGYRWSDRSGAAGVRKVLFKRGARGGLLAVAGKGSAWSYAIAGPQQGPIDVLFAIGADVWCARFDAAELEQRSAGRVRAANAPAPAGCALPQTCGNGVVEGTEECDDGNTASGDGCSATCELESAAALCAGVPTAAGTALATVAVATGLARPTDVQAPPLDPGRLFVVEQIGRIRLVRNGALLDAPFLDIRDKTATGCPVSERGLLGLAFDPGYETNGRFYVDYTSTRGDTVIARYVAAGDPKTADTADAGSETILRTIPQPFPNHNGGQLRFGPDGLLYVGMGDGGSSCDPGDRAQDDGVRLGKLLRFDPNAPAPATPQGDVWAKGLRNPWRFGFDRATGDLYVADVGQDHVEEVDVVAAPVPAGLDYGWPFFEGNECSNVASCPARTCPGSTAGFVVPVATYTHEEGCSITGGAVYRGCALPDLRGTYFYSDFCSAFVRTFRFVAGAATDQQDRTADLAPPTGPLAGVTTFGEDARGEMYVAERGECSSPTGAVYRIVAKP